MKNEVESDNSVGGFRIDRRYVLALVFGIFLLVAVTLLSNPGFFPFIRDLASGELLATSTPRPTYTPLPTYTTEATFTQFPTYTPPPTSTPTATTTPSSTPTSTPTSTATGTATLKPTYTPTPTLIPIYQHIQEMGQLVVISSELARADIHVGISRGACSHGADHAAHAVIEAGVNFGEIDEEDIRYYPEIDTYTLHIPAPNLTSCRMEYIRQYDKSHTWCGVDWDMVRLLGQAQSMQDFVDRAKDNEILDRAEKQTRTLLGSFVNALTGSKALITFLEGYSQAKPPSSCQPEQDIPRGWSYDEDSNTWSHSN